MRSRATARRSLSVALVASTALLAAACSSGDKNDASPSASNATKASASASSASPTSEAGIYSTTQRGMFAPQVEGDRPLVYVPNTLSDSVQVIDPKTYQIIDRFAVDDEPHHVVPSWDLKTLWVNNTQGNSLTPIDPKTGKAGPSVPIVDPYNLYFTPDGKFALVMAERFNRIDAADPKTLKVDHSLPMPCNGVNHADYDEKLEFFVASCEFSGHLIVIDKYATKVLKVIDLNKIVTPGATPPHDAYGSGLPQAGLDQGSSAMPQDVRLTPDGKHFLAADMLRNGVWVIDAKTLEYVKFIESGKGTHAIYPSRDAKRFFVSNRDEGTVTVVDAKTLEKTDKWVIPGGGSPDMGGVTDDGKELWLSGRYHAEVYVFDTTSGELTHRIKTETGAHGLVVWPQPGRFSLGHTANMR